MAIALRVSRTSRGSQNCSSFFNRTNPSPPDRGALHRARPNNTPPPYMSTAISHTQTASNGHRTALGPGVEAPEFTLRCTPDQSVSLGELRGRPVILAFYPADWSPVCGDQMALYNEILGEFQEFEAELLGISVDGAWCHCAFAEHNKLHFPLLADFEPKGAVARAYGVYDQKNGTSERALFVIEPEGIVHWSYVSPVGVNPGANGILSALEDLKAKNETIAAAK